MLVNGSHSRLVWKVVPTHTPHVYRRCEKCRQRRSFYCSEKFRINAHRKKLDVWLIYKCGACDATWNCTLFSCVGPRSIDPDLFARLQHNDQRTAWSYAFDYALLKRNGVVVDPAIAYSVVGDEIDCRALAQGQVTIVLMCDYRLPVRLDTLLSSRLGLSRRQLEALVADGGLRIDSEGGELREKLQEAVVVVVDRAQLDDLLTGTVYDSAA
jgi:hypothetical protein